VNLLLALIAYVAALVAYASVWDCHPHPPWRPVIAVETMLSKEWYCMTTPDELLLAAQRVEAAMEALIDAMMSAGLQQAEACRAHNTLDRVYSEHPAIVREFLAAHDGLNSEEMKR